MADIGELDDEALAALNEFLSNDLNAGNMNFQQPIKNYIVYGW